jgi:hypothetical protein
MRIKDRNGICKRKRKKEETDEGKCDGYTKKYAYECKQRNNNNKEYINKHLFNAL